MNNWNSERLSALGTTALRLGLAAVFFGHSYAKLFVFTLPGTAQFFAAHGFPGWTAYPVTVAELLGAVALLLGLRTRIVAAALIAVLFGALRVHAPNGWMFSNAGGGWEYVAFLIAALGAQVLLGSGAYSVNRGSDARSLP
ncbi:DoxX family protein [Pendulispora rubella]|uniref:DoxX family protein n=1 Tax=Pendulispora rubella TaxID=2741070 RepID=A0ABZ2LDP6_9BACT